MNTQQADDVLAKLVRWTLEYDGPPGDRYARHVEDPNGGWVAWPHVERALAALVEIVTRQPQGTYTNDNTADVELVNLSASSHQEILSRETVDEPPEDLRAAGEAMAWADYDEMLGCIAMILSAHRLNGETHAHMLRWKIRQLAASVSDQQEPPCKCGSQKSEHGPDGIWHTYEPAAEGQQEPPQEPEQGWKPIEEATPGQWLVHYREGGITVRWLRVSGQWEDVVGNPAGLPTHYRALPDPPSLIPRGGAQRGEDEEQKFREAYHRALRQPPAALPIIGQSRALLGQADD